MFRGRIGVGDYWKSVLLLLLITVPIAVVGVLLFGFLGAMLFKPIQPDSLGGVLAGALGAMLFAFLPLILAVVFSFFVGLGLQIRRLHDVGLPGWIILILWGVSAIIEFFGKTGVSPLGIPEYAPWAWALMGVGIIAWLVIALWPGKMDTNTYGAPVVYGSWWAAMMGKKSPEESIHKVVWIAPLVILGLLALAVAAYIMLRGTTPIVPPPSLGSTASDTFATTSDSSAQSGNISGTGATKPLSSSSVTPQKTAPPAPASPYTSIIGIGIIPPNTFTSNSFLESNYYTTPKGTQTLRPPVGWKGGVVFDAWLKSPTKPNGLTSVQFVDPSKSDGSAVLMVLVADKDADFSLAADEAKQAAKSPVIRRSDVNFYGMPGYMLEQTAVQNGVNLHLKSVTIASPTKVYVMAGTSKEGDWSSYNLLYTAAFATLQVR